MTTCVREGCAGTAQSRGMCTKHYDAWRHATPRDQWEPPPTQSRRFEDFVDKSAGPDGCWLWTGPTNRKGYGGWHGNGTKGLAHRLALAGGSPMPPPHIFACHHCDNPPCVNPAHLYWGTARDNGRDVAERTGQWNKGTFKAICLRGHRVEGDNLVLHGRDKKRRCRECARIRAARALKKRGERDAVA